MGKGYKKRRNKVREHKPRPDTIDGVNFVSSVVERGNFKMECYYALQGLHNQRLEAVPDNATGGGKSFRLVECKSNAEREAERLAWRGILGEILPASFRIGKDVPSFHQTKLTQELETLLHEAAAYVPPSPAHADETSKTDRLTIDPRAGPLPQESVVKLQRLLFLPHAYQLGLDRATIRKNPALEPLHAWLKQQVASGAVTRQETVSMVPPILLSVVATDFVLDMCAAPGSKTSQLLEDLSCNTVAVSKETVLRAAHVGSTNDGSTETQIISGRSHDDTAGVLVANDASAARAHMLVHQLRRILHHHPVALITACPAQFFASGIVQFDKILCDVPCTGDGTTRKNIGVWKTWSATGALALHALQLSIAVKGSAQLLKVGGLMVYSTCSFNPIENEAVVAELLRQSKGALELVDYGKERGVSNEMDSTGPLNGFNTRPGVNTWKVMCEDTTERQRRNRYKKQNAKMKAKRKKFEDSKEAAGTEAIKDANEDDGTATADAATPAEEEMNLDPETPERKVMPKFEPTSLDESTLLEMAESEGLRYYATYDDVPEAMQKRIRASSFPPTPEEASTFHLERCLRCLPQDNNTGGFFVALLRKTAPWSGTDRRYERRNKQQSSNIELAEPESKRARGDLPTDTAESTNEVDEDDDDVDAVEALDTIVDIVVNNDDDDDIDDHNELPCLDADNKPVRGKAETEEQDFGKDDFAEVDDDIMAPLIEHYGLSNGFEKDLYMARACSESKVIYYVARPVKRLFDLGMQKRVPIVNTGLKGFMRNNRNVAECAVSYRVCQEGIHFLAPYMTKRKFSVGLNDFRSCLGGDGKTIHLSQFSETFRDQVTILSPGSFVVVLEGYEDQGDQKLISCMWKCRGESVDGLVTKVEVEGILSKLDSIEQNQVS